MKIRVVGAGSIGGLLGVKLALAGEDVTLIARGKHLEAIRKNGLRIFSQDGSVSVAGDVKATSEMRACGPQDLVILGLKAHQIEPVVDAIRTLFGPDTMVLTTQNGLPWWYFQRHGGEFDGYHIETLDPDGRLTDGIAARRIIGCIAYPAATIVRPGAIRHIEGTRFPVGELDGSESERVQRVSESLIRAGFKSPVLTDTPTPTIGAIYAAVKLLGRTIEAESVFVKARALTPPVLTAVPVEEPALVGTAAG